MKLRREGKVSAARFADRILAAIGIGLIRLYQWCLSPLIGPVCRYSPSCSHYGIEALRHHGLWRGSRLTLARLLRCHPWGGSGYDPVPSPRPAIAPRPNSRRADF